MLEAALGFLVPPGNGEIVVFIPKMGHDFEVEW